METARSTQSQVQTAMLFLAPMLIMVKGHGGVTWEVDRGRGRGGGGVAEEKVKSRREEDP